MENIENNIIALRIAFENKISDLELIELTISALNTTLVNSKKSHF